MSGKLLRGCSLYVGIAAVLILAHLPVLHLPYFWDEAGYYIPAARDLLLTASLIPHSTLSNAHPPLVMACLAIAWKIVGYSPVVTRVVMLLIAGFALLGVFRLAEQIATRGVAIASAICVALYPVFFAQSSMALVDLAAAGLTFWGLLFYLRKKFLTAALWFSAAALAKETAIITPLAMFAWEIFLALTSKKNFSFASSRTSRLWLLFPLLPLIGWFSFHYAETGFIFGNPEFFRYNATATLQPLRIVFAFIRRGWQLTGHMNLFVLTIAAALAMLFPAQIENSQERERIALSVQQAFAVVIAAYWIALSLIGGAVLARYMLPAIPLVVMICVSTIRRRIRAWPLVIAIACAAFVAGLFFNPPYVFAPEDNLAYTDYVILHQHAATFLQTHARRERILTAWPATDELSKTYLGYVDSPLWIVPIEDFTTAQLENAARSQPFSTALVFSTKYEPQRQLPTPKLWREAQARFFGYHQDASPREAAQILKGQIIFSEDRGGQWVVVISSPETQNAALAPVRR